MRLHAHRHTVRARAEAAGTHSIITGDIGGTNARLGLWKCTDAAVGKSAQHTGERGSWPDRIDDLRALHHFKTSDLSVHTPLL
jgi:glucokinase